jgi:toxin CcdB
MAQVLMAQFDVYRNPSARTRRSIPLLLAVQHDGVSETNSVLMVPLVSPLKTLRQSRLYPVVDIENRQYMMLTPDMASLPRSVLAAPIGNLRTERNKIVAAIDILFVGS